MHLMHIALVCRKNYVAIIIENVASREKSSTGKKYIGIDARMYSRLVLTCNDLLSCKSLQVSTSLVTSSSSASAYCSSLRRHHQLHATRFDPRLLHILLFIILQIKIKYK